MNAPNDEEQLGIVNVGGSGFHLITSGPNKNAFPSFAPDGRRIVYRTTGPEGEGLRILNLEDHSVTVLTSEFARLETTLKCLPFARTAKTCTS